MSLSHDELERIQRLRAMFLDDTRGERALPDYWRDEADLRAYQRVLGARIGWKWDAALRECRARGLPRGDDAVVLDFGCGAGIAAQRYAAEFGAGEILCFDRSPTAAQFAAEALRAQRPDMRARAVASAEGHAFDVLLASHVVSELDERGMEQLRDAIARSRIAILVESGNQSASRRLSALRDQFTASMHIVAPCTHRGACPALAQNGEWCHFFAEPPQEAFTSGEWARAGRDVGIDLRALPYAFVCFARDDIAAPAPHHRILGRPDVGKHEARAQVCEQGGLRTATVTKRKDPATWRLLKKDPHALRELPDTASH
jgi:SAM-dependent methyltransferase